MFPDDFVGLTTMKMLRTYKVTLINVVYRNYIINADIPRLASYCYVLGH